MLVFGVGAYWWRRRRLSGSAADRARVASPDAHAQIVKLYHELESALRRQGITRAPGTPPLAHAKALVEVGYPFAGDVLQLTETYQAVRFGNAQLSPQSYTDLAKRIESLRKADVRAA